MPNPAIDLTSLATVKDHLGIPTLNTDQDTRLERLISSASRKIMNFCDRKFVQETHTEYQHGRRSNSLVLKQWPADKPTELNIDPESTFGVDTQVDTTEYEVLHDSILILLNGQKFPKGTRNIKIVYQASYATIPEDLDEACVHQVEYMYNLTADRRLGQITKSKSGVSVTYVQEGMPQIVTDALMPYKRHEFPTANAPVENG